MNHKKYSIEDEVEITDLRDGKTESEFKKNINIDDDLSNKVKESLSNIEEDKEDISILNDEFSQNNDEILSKDESNISNSELLQELAEYKDKYVRLLAEIDNQRKRSDKLQKEASIYAITDFSKNLLSIIDIFYKAMSHIDINSIQDPSFKNFAIGIDMTHKEFIKILNKFKIQEIDTTILFNPNLHDALYFKPDETKENGYICEIIENGYLLDQRLLRPAKVGIIKNN